MAGEKEKEERGQGKKRREGEKKGENPRKEVGGRGANQRGEKNWEEKLTNHPNSAENTHTAYPPSPVDSHSVHAAVLLPQSGHLPSTSFPRTAGSVCHRPR